ncbi:MAG: hypothetical protein KC657_17275 [Myxococcales bacterium]|nr:hypothetical protein [Myxococcales bacterium]
MRRLALCWAWIAVGCALAACTTTRGDDAERVGYRGRVASLLDAKCARCHAGGAPAGAWRADSYVHAIGCGESGRAATVGPDAPLVAALERGEHRGLLTPDERALLERWISLGAPGTTGGTHPPSFADPRSPDGHARMLRDRKYRPMIDATDRDACGRCHDGVAARPGNIAFAAPGATACTTCHDQPGGALACGTCHGSGDRAAPPRDPCFFPAATAKNDAHAAHTGASPSKAGGLPCGTCHPVPAAGELGPLHVNGSVEVWFDYALAGRLASFDPVTGACTGTCHERGGGRQTPSWREPPAAYTCTGCHRTPPDQHFPKPCSGCHAELDADGALVRTKLHINGQVDVGDGSMRCGACHGSGDDPWPTTGAHAAHARPKDAAPVACETCHVVPRAGVAHPVGGPAKVRLAGLALVDGARGVWDPSTRSCAGTWCHAGRGAVVPTPAWDASPAARACGACHALPPPPPHPESDACGSCHAGMTSTSVSPAARVTHIDGFVTRGSQ